MTHRNKVRILDNVHLKKKQKRKKAEIKQDFPKTCCCTICWWITMYHKVPGEDRHPQLAWLHSSVPTFFFKKQASSSTSLGTCGVRIKPVAIMVAPILFPAFNFFWRCKKKDVSDFPNQFNFYTYPWEIWSAQWSFYFRLWCRAVSWIHLPHSTAQASKIAVR